MLRAEFGLAVMLLTRVPAQLLLGDAPVEPGRSVWAYPIVGAAIGAVGGLVFMGAGLAGLPSALAAVWTFAALAVLTGALHEDGLADLADGFGGGRTVERKLEIMRDSRVGSYGVLALVLAMSIRVVALAGATHPVAALIVAGALSRAAIGLPLLLLRPARAGGLGASMVGGGAAAWAGFALGIAIALLSLPLPVAALCVGGAAAAGWAVAALARGQIGGFTGDVLGSVAVVADCVVLSVLA